MEGRPDQLRILLLGPFRAEVAGAEIPISVRKSCVLLAELALRGGRAFGRDEIVAQLWPDSDNERGRDSFRHVLWRLRAELGEQAAALIARGEDLRLEADVDIRSFERDAAGTDALTLQSALDLYRGDLCKELEGNDAEAERTRLRAVLADAGRRLVDLRLEAGDTAGAIGAARAVLRHDPFREDTYRLVLRAHARAGDRAALGAEYRRLTALLRDELGVEPSAETRDLYASLITTEPAARTAARVRRPVFDAPSTLVGRGREHRRLVELLVEAIDRKGHAVLVVGEAGAGKTALVDDTTRLARAHGLTVVAAHGASAEGHLAYQAWRDALRPHGAAAATLPVPWPQVLSALVPVAAGEADAGTVPPEFERPRLFEGVARLLSSLASTAPLLVALDDAHWLDADSCQLFHYLVRTLRGERVAFVAAARPADAGSIAPFGAARERLRAESLVDEIELASLAPDAVQALLRQAGVAPATAEWLAPRMADWTAGNPLFLLEGVRALVEQGALRSAAGGLEWYGSPPGEGQPLTAQLPTGVRQTLMARIGVLPTEARQLLGIASTIGRTFAPEVLAAVTARDELGLLEALEPAIDARLLREDVLDGRPALAFSHDLVRDATYQQLASVTRAAIHRRVAAALEARGAPSALLALHYTAASDLPRAAAHWLDAARVAERAFAHEEALRAYAAALAALPSDAAQRLEVLERIGDVHLRRGIMYEALQAYDKLLAQAPADDLERIARVRVKIAFGVGRHYGEHPQAREFAEAGVAYFSANQPESAEMADALLALMAMQYQEGDTEAVERTAARTHELCRRLDLPHQEATAFSILAWSRYVDGDALYAPAADDVERLVAKLGDDDEAAQLLVSVARPANRRGDFALALDRAREAVRIATRVGSLRVEEAALEAQERALLRFGRWSEAGELARRRLGLLPRLETQDVMDPLVTLALAQLLGGDPTGARATARTLSEALGEMPAQPTLHLTTRGEALLVYVLVGLPGLLPPAPAIIRSRPRCGSCQHPWLAHVGLITALHGDADEALRHADALESRALRSRYTTAAGYAPLIRTLALVRLGRPKEAETQRAEAERLFGTPRDALGLGILEVLAPSSTRLSTVVS